MQKAVQALGAASQAQSDIVLLYAHSESSLHETFLLSFFLFWLISILRCGSLTNNSKVRTENATRFPKWFSETHLPHLPVCVAILPQADLEQQIIHITANPR